MKSKWVLLFTLSILIFSGGCASHEKRNLTPRATDSYLTKETVSGVTIAVEAYSTKKKVEEAFTIDLTEEGIVPILLIMDNKSNTNYVLLKDEIELVDTQGNVKKPVPADVMMEKFEHNKMVYALLGFGIFSYMSAEEANEKMLSDWSGKELPAEKVLMPNRKAYGALYFDLGKGLSTLPNSTLTLNLRNLQSNQIHKLDIKIPESLPLSSTSSDA